MTQHSNFSADPKTPAACIQVSDLTVTKSRQTICHVPSLQVLPQQRIGITGSNGSGKTTLLRVLAGLEPSFQGQCQIDAPQSERVYVHQSPYLFCGTILSNVEYGLKARSIGKQERRDLAMTWLERLKLNAIAHRAIESLSGGEARRTALARACVLKPRLLLLDEPLADLDPAGIECVMESIHHLPDSTILISSPSPLPPELVQRTFEL